MVAAEHGHLDTARLLLSHGASVHADDEVDEVDPPLSIACQDDHFGVASLLLDAGVDLAAASSHGTPLELANSLHHNTVAAYIRGTSWQESTT